MKTIAYLRVSTDTQDIDNQRLAILDYAMSHELKISEFISFQGSSKNRSAKQSIVELLCQLSVKPHKGTKTVIGFWRSSIVVRIRAKIAVPKSSPFICQDFGKLQSDRIGQL
jgi:DNA invertase Pin-like site-specific DNA recombinase